MKRFIRALVIAVVVLVSFNVVAGTAWAGPAPIAPKTATNPGWE